MHGWMEGSLHEAIDELARSGRNDLASDLNRIMARIDFDTLEVLRCSGAEGTADAILEAASVAELVGLLGQLCHVMGLMHCTLHVISESPSTNFSTKVLTTYPDEWVSQYVERRYSCVDPVGKACLAYDHGFFWDTLDHRVPILQTFWADALAHGIGPSGFTQPITTERGDKVAISVCTTAEPEAFRDQFERYTSDLFSLGIFLADAFCRLASDDRPVSFDPTDDQLAILRAIAMGAGEPELRERTYQDGSYATLERSICALFRTRTVAQAAVMAARIGLLADAPLTKADVLAASGKAGRVVVTSPNGASLRRLARLRTPTPEAGGGAKVLRMCR